MIGALLVLALVGATSVSSCEFNGEPERWTAGALEAWDRLDRERIRSEQPAIPTLVLFDQDCAWTLSPSSDGVFGVGARRYTVRGAVHAGEVVLPGGGSVPARKLSFAFPTDQGPAFVMALPAIWRADVRETRDPERLAMLVFMHEFAHTQQMNGLGRRIDDLVRRGLAEDVDDDIIQNTFGDDADYRAAWEAERDLIYRAAGAPDEPEVRRLLAEALEMMRARRDRRHADDQALMSEADDAFLTFEGSGNWAAWAWLTDPRGGRLDVDEALGFIRGGGRFWSQDEGLALALALDRLDPDWASSVFSPEALTFDTLAGRAVGATSHRP